MNNSFSGDMKQSSILRRVAAYFVDFLLLYVSIWVLAVAGVFGSLVPSFFRPAQSLPKDPSPLLIAVIMLGYFLFYVFNSIVLVVKKGGTVGKLINGLQIMDTKSNRSLNIKQAIIREFGKLLIQIIIQIFTVVEVFLLVIILKNPLSKISIIFPTGGSQTAFLIIVAVLLIALILNIVLQVKLYMRMAPGNRGLQDILARTQVVQERKGLSVVLQIILILGLILTPFVITLVPLFAVFTYQDYKVKNLPVSITTYVERERGWSLAFDSNRYEIYKVPFPTDIERNRVYYRLVTKKGIAPHCVDTLEIEYIYNPNRVELLDYVKRYQILDQKLYDPLETSEINTIPVTTFSIKSDIKNMSLGKEIINEGENVYFVFGKGYKLFILTYTTGVRNWHYPIEQCVENETKMKTIIHTFRLLE